MGRPLRRAALAACWLAAAFELPSDAPPCVVELPGVGLVATQVDLVSPTHRSRWPLGDPVPLSFLVEVQPSELAAYDGLLFCAGLDGEAPKCAPLGRIAPAPLRGLAAGEHAVEAYLVVDDERRTRVDCNLRDHDAVTFFVDEAPPPFPLRVVRGPQVVVRIEAAGACPAAVDARLRHAESGATVDAQCLEYKGAFECVAAVAEPGIYEVFALLGDGGDVASAPRHEVRVFGAFGTAAASLVAVTAADDGYFRRLANLVGSLHFWEPGLAVDFYDLGLAPANAAAARGWADVRVRRLPERGAPGGLPAHVYDEVHLVGWKFWVVLDALERDARVLWLDANAELRRPLDAVRAGAAKGRCNIASMRVRAALDADGHFFTVAGLYPADAVNNTNNRRDQSAFNAALCALRNRGDDDLFCRADRRFWMWKGQSAFVPADDPGDWNDMVLYSRRGRGAAYVPRGGG
ncbi:hypothetical protein SO694_00069199 [Aureococcus anophagefferens]|uniref:Uncharacterized protein n=1 Tax=Aureococcus anophagefferens TaxID=44056 RepID=A0ABR1FQ50_AURAN